MMTDPLGGAQYAVLEGDNRETMRGMPDACVQVCFTSPPYFGLRDYSAPASVWGGDNPDCAHEWAEHLKPAADGTLTLDGNSALRAGHQGTNSATMKPSLSYFCQQCGAWYGCLGAEPTPKMFVAHLVEVFREVKRVLRDDGCCFVNIGDSYFGDSPTRTKSAESFSEEWDTSQTASRGGGRRSAKSVNGLRPKSLCLVPERLAIALADDGWIIRNRCSWMKGCSFLPEWSGSVMPSSAGDRFTVSEEPVWFLTKRSVGYYFDQAAVMEVSAQPGRTRNDCVGGASHEERQQHSEGGVVNGVTSRIPRNVWAVATEPLGEGHFAAFPERLSEIGILAASAEKSCAECGAPWERVVERGNSEHHCRPGCGCSERETAKGEQDWSDGYKGYGGFSNTTVASDEFRPTCACGTAPTVGSIILDPFAGSGTTGRVSLRLGRRFIGCEINEEYAALARRGIDKWHVKRPRTKPAPPKGFAASLFADQVNA